jgi:hypothetical protein
MKPALRNGLVGYSRWRLDGRKWLQLPKNSNAAPIAIL